jgi:hypothetical protein
MAAVILPMAVGEAVTAIPAAYARKLAPRRWRAPRRQRPQDYYAHNYSYHRYYRYGRYRNSVVRRGLCLRLRLRQLRVAPRGQALITNSPYRWNRYYSCIY